MVSKTSPRGQIVTSPKLLWVNEYHKLSQLDKVEFLDRAEAQEFGIAKRRHSRKSIVMWTMKKADPPLEVAKWATAELKKMLAEISELASSIVQD